MGLENVQSFLLAAAADSELTSRIAHAVSVAAGREAAQRFAALGQAEGFQFTAEEAFEALKHQARSQLTEDDLQKITGGAGVTPYTNWLSAAAASAETAATQANAAASAFEAAFSATVPPPVIATNRDLLATLVATNLFGQNTPAAASAEGIFESQSKP